MSERVIRVNEIITPERLTQVLAAAGVILTGDVSHIRQLVNEAFNSAVTHLVIRYSDGAPDNAPRTLLLKRMSNGWGENEIAFYRSLHGYFSPPVVHCYDAAFDAAFGASHLLLEDLSATHSPPISRTNLIQGTAMPSRRALDAMMSALAALHARWWEDPRLGGGEPFSIRSWFSSDNSVEQHVSRRRRELDALTPHDETVANYLPLYEEAWLRLPDLWERCLRRRIRDSQSLALTHGDCYFTQWLLPHRSPEATFLVDFDSVSGNLGAFDLVFLLATFWSPAQRAQHELECLRTYHATLVASGVQSYSWEDLLLDYRLMLAFIIFDAVFDQANGSSAHYWRRKMECLVSAYQDWDCASL